MWSLCGAGVQIYGYMDAKLVLELHPQSLMPVQGSPTAMAAFSNYLHFRRKQKKRD